jgi:hypothetical protein
MLRIAFRTEGNDEGGLPRVDARLASEMVVLTQRAGEHHETMPAPGQEWNRIEKTLAEISTMSYT